jgi:hypothetical protein
MHSMALLADHRQGASQGLAGHGNFDFFAANGHPAPLN